MATTRFRTSRLTCAGHSCSCCMQSSEVAFHGWSGVQTTVALSCSTACESRINKYRGLPIMLCMNPRRQPWSSSSRNNNDIQNIIIFQLIMHDCTFLKCGVQQTICFKPLAHRSVKLTFSGRLSLTETVVNCLALTLTTHVRIQVCLYQ